MKETWAIAARLAADRIPDAFIEALRQMQREKDAKPPLTER
jgi:hypothetical protein